MSAVQVLLTKKAPVARQRARAMVAAGRARRSKPMRAGHFAAAGEQLIKDAAIELPGTVLVGIGQRGTLGRVRQAQMAQRAFAGGQPAADFAQRLRAGQMAEQHGHELAPTRKPTSVPFGAVLSDGLLKLGARKQLQHLAENAGYSCHGGSGPPLWFTSLNATRSRVLPPPLKP